MRIRDTLKNFCDMCWVALYLTGAVWVLMTVLFLIALFTGMWSAATFFGCVSLAYGGMLCLVSYLEARNHWKAGQ